MTDQYIYAEPEEVTLFKDAYGCLHHTREDAIDANIKIDLSKVMDDREVFARDASVDLFVTWLKRNRQIILEVLDA